MADWPRSIRPEDRIRYLVNARTEVGLLSWDQRDAYLVAHSNRYDKLTVWREDGVYEAWYTPDEANEGLPVEGKTILVGEFDTAREAQKALIDHLVVVTAIAQAWEDVAI